MAFAVPLLIAIVCSCSPTQDPQARRPAPPPGGLAPVTAPADRMVTRRPWLGIQAEPIHSDVAMQLPLRKGAGLVVQFVEPGSPAEAAGLQRFDILEMVDDQFLINVEQLAGLIRAEQPGAPIQLTWLRRGERKQASVTLGERAEPARTGIREDLSQREQAQRDQPQRDQPQRDQPQRDQPQRDQPQRNQPQRGQAQRDQGQRENAAPRMQRQQSEQSWQRMPGGPDARERWRARILEQLADLPADQRDAVLDRIMAAIGSGDAQVEIEVWEDDGAPTPPPAPRTNREERRRSTSSSSAMTMVDGSVKISVTKRDDAPAAVRIEDLDDGLIWEGHVDPSQGDGGGLNDVPQEFRGMVESLLRR